MLDRIDIHIEVPAVEYEKLAAPFVQGASSHEGQEIAEEDSSTEIRKKVENARLIQQKRFRELPILTNAEMGLREIKEFIKIGEHLRPVLKRAHEKHHLSARAYHKVLKLARTIADLENSEEIGELHLSEALQYRPKQEI